MVAIHVDPAFTGEQVREAAFRGELTVFTKLPSVRRFVDFTIEELTRLFAPHDPEHAHEFYSPEEMAARLGVWKPHFIHDEQSAALVRGIAVEAGLSATDTYFDVPKPRTAFPMGHLSTGIAFAFPWHRDTWYAAPKQQLNWWLPVFPVREDNAMKFDLEHFARPVPNDSGGFDYYQANQDRLTAAAQVGTDTRSRPGAAGFTSSAEIVVLPNPGSVLVFSGSSLHASIPNTSPLSRYSVDFRLLDRRDVETGAGAPLVDVECTGTSLRDFRSIATGERLPETLVRAVGGEPPADALLVFDDAAAEQSAQAIGVVSQSG
jgi:hypothetical protein